jgi:uncharacterized protein (TIGR00251 family)
MPRRNYHLHDGKRGAALAVRVTPRASRNQITEVLSDGTVKIHLTAAPTEGQANEALIKFLAGILDVAPSKIEIVAGMTGRDKLVSVLDISASDLHQRVIENIS